MKFPFPKTFAFLLCSTSCMLTAFTQDTATAPLDTLILGDAASEQVHFLTDEASKVIEGGLGQPARQLQPLEPVSYNGGHLDFTLKVDPEKQNYITVKFWGSDQGKDRGRLLLYLDGKQVGYRHEGDHDVLNQSDEDPLYLGRFFYQTVALPLTLTQGKSRVHLKIGAIGPMWSYGQFFKQKQKDLTSPSRGIYRVYSHNDPRFVPPSDEKQGPVPESKIRPPGPVDETIAATKEKVNSQLTRALADEFGGRAMGLLAEAYHVPWTVAYKNPDAVRAFTRAADAFIKPGLIGPQWSGAGPLGEALVHLGPDPILLKALDEKIEVPIELPFVPVTHRPDVNKDATYTVPELSGKTMQITRREAWTRFLRASVDWNRTLGRRSYTNQSMIVDFGIYAANRGIVMLAPNQALPEKDARRYLYESAGLLPWFGNDLPDANGNGLPDDGSEKPYGSSYHLMTKKGTSRELGWVGTYGETILKFVLDMARMTNDPKLKDHLVNIQTKRLFFRYPSVDADGYRTMKLTSEIDARTAHFPKKDAAYAASDVNESWWMDVAAYTQDPVSVGASQHNLSDNQYYPRLARRAKENDITGMMRNADEYETVKKLPKSPFQFPGDDGQPDFVFADEENAVIAMKHGDRRIFVNFYFRQEHGVSGVTRILEVEPQTMRIATVLADFEVDGSGEFYSRPDYVDFMRTGGFPPPDEDIHQAWAGEKLPIAKRPTDAISPAYGNWGPFVGKAEFYQLRYGDYLFAINTTENKTFKLTVPEEIGEVRELVSQKTVKLDSNLDVPPLTSVVLYLGHRMDR